MQQADFDSIHRHGFIRVAAATPLVATADPARNALATIDLIDQADREGRRPGGFPGARPLLLRDRRPAPAGRPARRGRGRDRAAGRGERGARTRCSWSARRCGATAASTTARWRSRAGGSSAWCRRASCPTTANITRSAGSPRGGEHRRADDRVGRPGRALRHGPALRAPTTLPDFVFHVEICEDFWAPLPPSTVGALAGALILANLSASNITIGKADERHLLCASQSARCHRRLRLFRRRARREHHRPRLGRPGHRSTSSATCSPRPSASRLEPELCIADVDARPHPRRADAHADLQRQCRRAARPS